MDLDPGLLRAFATVHEAGGFTPAARRLNLTQSAVSHQVRRLEQQLGRTLLRRTTRRVALTEDGHDLLRLARPILASMDELGRRFAVSRLAGVVRFGMTETSFAGALPALLAQFARSFPLVRLDVAVGMSLDLRGMLRTGALDVALVFDLPARTGGVLLATEHLVWAAAESWRGSDVDPVPLALHPAPCVNRGAAIAALLAASRTWRTVFTCASAQALKAAVLAGLAVAPLERSQLMPGMRVADASDGLPALPSGDLVLLSAPGVDAAGAAFARLISEAFAPPTPGRD